MSTSPWQTVLPGRTSAYGLYSYVPRDGVWFLGIIFAPFGIVFMV